MLPAVQGTALVRVERSGFTAVERQANVASNAVVTLLDARLTPLDGRVNSLQSIFGGEAASADGTATLSMPSGSLESDVTLRVTPISNQGLQGVLPLGWSPIAAVDLQPAGRRFTQGATLRLPHVDTLPAGVPVTLARYDAVQHQWVVQAAGQVSNDRRTLSAAIDLTGQFAFLVADESPAIPPPAVPGQALAGVTPVADPDASTAAGKSCRAPRRPATARRRSARSCCSRRRHCRAAWCSERASPSSSTCSTPHASCRCTSCRISFSTRVRTRCTGSLATRLPITPSLQFSIHQLSLGTVRLDVTIDEPASADSIVGDTGGSITDPAGNVLAVPPGSLSADVAIGLLPLGAGQLSAPVPTGFTFLGGGARGSRRRVVCAAGVALDSAPGRTRRRRAGRGCADHQRPEWRTTAPAGRAGGGWSATDLDPDHAGRAVVPRRAQRWRVRLPARGPATRLHHRSDYRVRRFVPAACAGHRRHRALCGGDRRVGCVYRRRPRRREHERHGARTCRRHGIRRRGDRRPQRRRDAQPERGPDRASGDRHDSRAQRGQRRTGHSDRRRFFESDRPGHGDGELGRVERRAKRDRHSARDVGQPPPAHA